MKRQRLSRLIARLNVCMLGLLLFAATTKGLADSTSPPAPIQAANADTKEIASDSHQVALLRFFVDGIIENAQWPTAPSHKVTLCVAGNAALLDSLQSRPLINRGGLVKLQAIAENTNANRMHDCSVLLIGQSISETTASHWVLSLIGSPIITIRENPEQCRDGTLICLYTAKSHTPTFDINLDSVSRSGVVINPLVLTLSNSLPSNLLPQTAMQ